MDSSFAQDLQSSVAGALRLRDLYVVISDSDSCNNPMGIYDDFEKAKCHADELLLDKIHARVCRYTLNEKVYCYGNTMTRVYENELITDEERNEKILMNSII
jgi:hypothetical protein